MSPPEFGKLVVCVTSLPQPASCLPSSPSEMVQPACLLLFLPPPQRHVWTLVTPPHGAPGRGRKNRQPVIIFPSLSPLPTWRCVRRQKSKSTKTQAASRLNFIKTSVRRDAKNWGWRGRQVVEQASEQHVTVHNTVGKQLRTRR